ncbi:MAG TPA: GFA family protein [Kofleriaceae bacterium]
MALSTQHGGCHCGAVRYQVDIDLEAPALSCNCSMCGRAGTLLQFVPESAFKLEQGEQNLVDYQFNKHVIHHLFCKTCGIKPFARGSGPKGPTVAVNMRTLDDVDTFKIATSAKPFDGKHH